MRQSEESVLNSSEEHVNTKLQEENAVLKDQVIRLNRELSTYQKKLGPLPKSSNQYDHVIDIPTSMSDGKVITPLLTSYDQRIEELSTFIERQGSVLDALTQRSNDLLDENKNLRNRIIGDLQRKTNDNEQEHRVQSKKEDNVSQLRNDKHLLEEQAELLAKELHASNETIASRDTNISILTEQVKNKLALIQKQNEMLQQTQIEKRNSEKELVNRIKALSIQKSQIENLKDSISILKQEQLNTLSKVESVEMDKHYLEAENESFTKQITQAASLIQELRMQVSSGANEYMDLNEKYLVTKKELEHTKVDLEKIRQSDTDIKFHFKLLSEKEKELQQSYRELKSTVKEVELSRDKAKAISSLLEKEMNRLLLESNGEEHAKNKSNLTRWRNDTCQEIKRRDNLIHSLKIQNTDLVLQAEKDNRQTETSETTLNNLERCIQKERNTTKSELATLEKELSDLTIKLKTEQLQKMELLNEKWGHQQEIITLQESITANEKELQRLLEDEKRKDQEYTESRMHLQKKINEQNARFEREVTKMLEEKESFVLDRDEIKHKKEVNFDSIQCKNHQLGLSLEEFNKSNQILRSEIRSIAEKSKNDLRELEAQYQEKIVEYKESLNDQMKRNGELLPTLRNLVEKNLNLDVSLKKRDNEIYHSDQKIVVLEEKVSLLSTQLHDNLSDQSNKLSQIKHLKMELRKLKMETARER